MLRHRHGAERPVFAHQGAVIRSGGDDDGVAQIAAQVVLDKLRDLPAPLPDQGHYLHRRFAAPDDHSHQRGLSHSASGKNPELLPFAAGEQPVDGFNPGLKNRIDKPPAHRGNGRLHNRGRAVGPEGTLIVNGGHKRVDHPAQQGVPYGNLHAVFQQVDVIAGAEPLDKAERSHRKTVVFQAGDHGEGAAVLAGGDNADHVPDAGGQPRRYDMRGAHFFHGAEHGGEARGFPNPLPQRTKRHQYRGPLGPLTILKNSSRVFPSWKMPRSAEVEVELCRFSTPRISIQRWRALITTATPLG